MVCDKELMLKNNNVYGSFYTTLSQTVLTEGDVVFDSISVVNGLQWNPTGSNPEQIKVLFNKLKVDMPFDSVISSLAHQILSKNAFKFEGEQYYYFYETTIIEVREYILEKLKQNSKLSILFIDELTLLIVNTFLLNNINIY